MKRELFGNTNLENCEEINYHYDAIRTFTLKIYNNYFLPMYNIDILHIDEETDAIIIKYKGE